MKTPVLYHVVAYTSFIISFTANILLIFLTKSRKLNKLGTYKHLITCFAFASIFYSTCDVIYQPVIIAKIGGHITFCSSPVDLGSSAEYVGALFAVNYGNTLLMIALHYIYRYFAVCNRHHLKWFRGCYFYAWIVAVLILDFLWFLGAFHLLRKTSASDEYLRSDMRDFYDEDISKVSYLTVLFKTEANGRVIYQRKSIVMIFFIILQQTITLFIIIFCAAKTMITLRGCLISKTAVNLQRKLFKMLLVQTGSPFILMYFSIVVLLIAPFYGYHVGSNSIYISCALAIYPATEPLIILYFLADFKKSIANSFAPVLNLQKKSINSVSVRVRNHRF